MYKNLADSRNAQCKGEESKYKEPQLHCRTSETASYI